ncbi:CorA family divalent cation transporter, partial [Clostridium sp. AL.422]|uniref:CorA family divalent cation transporter n=1 Tax=Clostridium TaxID=1485 RepID=UPI00293DBFF0
ICEDNNSNKDKENKVYNIHRDIKIKNKDMIILKIPILSYGEEVIINSLIDKDKFIVNYYNDGLIEFIREKISFRDTVNKHMVCLFVFQYFSYCYDEELLKIEERVDELFQRAINVGEVDNKEILEVKKSVSEIKKLTTYYKSMITYLDDEFRGIDLYDKVLIVLDNTLSLVEHIEGAIFSCIDVYNSELSNKMNKTMQLLTIITVISLPLTIMSGIFGMNFQNMPLINSNGGFIISIVFTVVLMIIEIIYFKRKKYL